MREERFIAHSHLLIIGTLQLTYGGKRGVGGGEGEKKRFSERRTSCCCLVALVRYHGCQAELLHHQQTSKHISRSQGLQRVSEVPRHMTQRWDASFNTRSNSTGRHEDTCRVLGSIRRVREWGSPVHIYSHTFEGAEQGRIRDRIQGNSHFSVLYTRP